MADEIITLVSKEYTDTSFQSKLSEANQGDNIKITGEGKNLKISAEVPAHGQTTITTSDTRVVVDKTETGYDLALNGSFIEEGEYRVLESTVGGHTASIKALDNDMNTVQTNVGTLNSSVASLEQSVKGNKQAITLLEQEVANKQDKLTASTGINLDGSTISVDTATSVGDSNLPVTASAVNTKLGDYVNDIQAADDSITVTKTGSSVTLKANGGSIDENKVITGRYETFGYGSNRFIADSKINAVRLKNLSASTDIGICSINLHDEDGPANADFTVQAMISSLCPSVTISIPCDDGGGYTAITSNGGTEIMRFEHDTSAGYDTHNTKIYFNTSVYDKDGNEITGGGGGGSDRVTTDSDGRTLILGNSSSEEYGALVIGTDDEFHQGEVSSPVIYSTGEYAALFIGSGENNFISFYRAYGADEPVIRIKIGTEDLFLNQAKLQKLKEWLES